MNDILETSEIGTSKRQSVKASPKPTRGRPNLKRDTQRAIDWVDHNILPVIALIIVSGLAVKGLQVFLPEMSEQTQLVVSIAAVSALVIKVKADYNR